MKRGDIVTVDFPYSDGVQSKFRPAVVVQNDRYNSTWKKTVIAMVTGNVSRRNDPAHLFVDPATDLETGLNGPSLVSCVNLYTIDQAAILRKRGQLPTTLLSRLDQCLIEALGITESL